MFELLKALGVMANRFRKHQLDTLNSAFEELDRLTREKKMELASAAGLDTEQVVNWYNRKRAQVRTRESKHGLEETINELQQALEESKCREAEIQGELEESMRREADLVAEIQRLRQQFGTSGTGSDINQIIRSSESSNVKKGESSVWSFYKF